MNTQTISSVKIAVIIGFYNGNHHLGEQVDSIISQQNIAPDIYIFDDHSPVEVDIENLKIPISFESKIHIIRREKNLGFAYNFLKALSDIPTEYDYYAFSDQDDIWHKNKLSAAITMIEETKRNNTAPTLYCGRTIITNADCTKNIGISPKFTRRPSFQNALVQNIGGGNTMVLNKAACDIVTKSLENIGDLKISVHDWWCYQIISGVGSRVIYDPTPYVYYRQHQENIIGTNISLIGKIWRIKGLTQGKFKKWIDDNCKLLEKNKKLLSDENSSTFHYFNKAREENLIARIVSFRKSKIHRQTFIGNLGLWIGIIMNKV